MRELSGCCVRSTKRRGSRGGTTGLSDSRADVTCRPPTAECAGVPAGRRWRTELGEELAGSSRSRSGGPASVTARKIRYLLHATPDEPGVQFDRPARRSSSSARGDRQPAGAGHARTPRPPREQRCPSCETDDAIRFLGSRVATLVSVALTQLFGSDLVADGEKKTLVFTDSVQDAAHRAAFIEGRAFQFNLRSALLRAVGAGPKTPAGRSPPSWRHSDTDDLYAITPPDFVHRLGLTGEWLGADPRGTRRSLLGTRLAFQAQLEVGLRSRLGRTLELTGALGVDYDVDLPQLCGTGQVDPRELAGNAGLTLPDTRAYEIWLLGLLDRLRKRGGIAHQWLTSYVERDGNRWPIWGGSPKGMPKFPKGRPAPVVLHHRRASPNSTACTRAHDSWLTNWTERALGVSSTEARALRRAGGAGHGGRGEPAAAAAHVGHRREGVRARPRRASCSPDRRRRGSTPRSSAARAATTSSRRRRRTLHGGTTRRARACVAPAGSSTTPCARTTSTGRCTSPAGCGMWSPTSTPRCSTARPARTSSGGSSPATRPIAPNMLTCTPTLELGIDIGDLSTVGLASLPRTPANYLQRVGRAGRSTGNALVLATVPSSPRDLYYLAEPKHLIDGEVTAAGGVPGGDRAAVPAVPGVLSRPGRHRGDQVRPGDAARSRRPAGQRA